MDGPWMANGALNFPLLYSDNPVKHWMVQG